MKKIAVHSLLLLIILGSGRLQAVTGPADKIRKNIECYFNDYLRGETPLYEKAPVIQSSQSIGLPPIGMGSLENSQR